jgi:PAS domain S-box-containing protein
MEKLGVKNANKVIGKTDFDFFTKGHAKQAYQEEQEIIKSKKAIKDKIIKEVSLDGKIAWISTNKVPWYDQEGNVIGILGISRDITEKKKLEEKLEEKVEKLGEEVIFKSNLLTSLIDNIPDLIYFKDRKSRFVELSKSIADRFALTKEAVIGKTDFDYFTKEHAEQAYKDEQKIINTGKPIEGKIEKETHPDGRVTWVSTTKIPRYDEKGDIVGTLGISRDVTLQKKTEEQLEESEARNRAILSALPDLLFQVRKDGTFISYYAGDKDVLYAKPDEFINKNIKDVLPKDVALQSMESIKKAIKKNETVGFEYQLPVKGEMKDWEARVAKSDEDTAIFLIRDITEIKKAQKEIARLNELIEQSSEAIIRMDTEMRIDYTNAATKELLGYPFSEIKGKTLTFLIAEPDSEKIQRDIFEEVSGGNIYSKEHLNIKKDGSVFFCEMRIMPLFDKNGKIYGYMGSLLDISEEKKARDELVFRKNLLDSLLELTPDEIFFKDTDCRFLEVSESKTKKFAVPKEEIIGKSDFSFLEAEIADKYFEEEQTIMNNLNPLLDREEKILDPDGKTSWISYSKVPRYDKEGNVIGLIGISRDITKLKKTEEELRKQEELLSNALESMEDGILVLDRNFHITYWNSSMEKISKVSRDKVLNSGKVPWKIFPNLKKTKVDEMMKQAMMGEVVKRERIPSESANRKRMFTSEMYMPLRNPEGDIYGIVGVVKEVTKEIEAEETVRESEEKYRILVESSKDGICIFRADRFLFVNDRLCEILRYSKEELYNTEIWEIISENDRNIIKEMERRREKGEEMPDVYEANIVTKNGDILFSEFSVRKITYQGLESFMIIIRDITEYKDMEKEREKADRLESLGILSGGIAHDFNNFLTGILGNISLAKLHLNPEDEAYEILRESEKAAQSAKGLTQQLLTFSKGGAPVKVNIDIEDSVRSSANFVLSGSNVRCNFELSGNLWNVKADKGQLTQIFNNLILNAVQAMPEGGIIIIRGKNLNIDKKNNLPLKNGKYVKIEIQDRGIGIPPEIIPKIFDPFFTTKQKGSGLGLSTVFSIIKRHEGHIAVESKMGEGTSFYIYLPATADIIIVEEDKEKKVLKGKGKILIMDDKSFVRNAAVKALKLFGYEVKGSTDGDEAVSLYKDALNEGKPFDIVILDLTIPGGMGGEDTLKKLREINPKVKAIVSSGYSEDPVMAEYKKHGFNAIVSKPYQYEDLCEVIRKVMKEDF